MLLNFLNRVCMIMQPFTMISWLIVVHEFFHGKLQHQIGLYASLIAIGIISLIVTLVGLQDKLSALYEAFNRAWTIWPVRFGIAVNCAAIAIAAFQFHSVGWSLLPVAGLICFARLYKLYRVTLDHYPKDWNGVEPPDAWANPPEYVIEPGDDIVSGHDGARAEGSPGGHAEQVGITPDGVKITISSWMDCGVGQRVLSKQLKRWQDQKERIYVLKPVRPDTKQPWPLTEEEQRMHYAFFEEMWQINKTFAYGVNRALRTAIRHLPFVSVAGKKWLVKKTHWSGYNYRALLRQDFKPFSAPAPDTVPHPLHKSWTCIGSGVELSYAFGRVGMKYGADFFGVPCGVVRFPIKPLEKFLDPARRYLTLQDKAQYEARTGIKLPDPPERVQKPLTFMDRVRLWVWGVY